jgi:hypothetical protein
MRRPTFYRGLMPGEKTFLSWLFGNTIPAFPTIGIGDGLGWGDRAWTNPTPTWMDISSDPRVAQQYAKLRIVMNMGDDATKDLSTTKYLRSRLAHECTHVWQFNRGEYVSVDSFLSQTLGAGYDYTPGFR